MRFVFRWLISVSVSIQFALIPLLQIPSYAWANETTTSGELQSLYQDHLNEPFNESKATAFLAAVTQNQSALSSNAIGQSLLARAKRTRMVLALKKKLDQCFGGDILELEAARLVLGAALDSKVEPDCSFSTSSFENLGQFTTDLEAFIQKDNSPDQALRRNNLVKSLFSDTAYQAAQAEARLKFLFKDPSSAPDLLKSICGSDLKKCPQGFIQEFQQNAKKMRSQLESAGYKPLTSSEISNRLNEQMSAMYNAVYDPARPYHAAQFDKDRWEALQPSEGDPPEYTRPAGEARLTFQPYASALTKPGLTAEEYKRNEETLIKSYSDAIPQSYYESQSALQNDQYGISLATSKDWMHALGHGATIKPVPFVMGAPGVMMGLVSTDRRNAGEALPLDEYTQLVTPESVLKNRDESLQRLSDTIGEMGQEVFAQTQDPDNDNDNLQKLLFANPKAAGDLLLQNPKNIDLFCESFLAIKSDEDFDKYMNWGLVGLTIGAAIFTGGASLLGAGALATTAGGATLAAVGAADVLYGMNEGFEATERGQMQHATCVSDGPESKACTEYEDSYTEAKMNFAFAGLGATGAAPLLRTATRAGKAAVATADNSMDAARMAAAADSTLFPPAIPKDLDMRYPSIPGAVYDNTGKVVAPPPNYATSIRGVANKLEADGFSTVMRRPGKYHAYEMICIEGGPKSSALGRISSSKGLGRTPICYDPFSENLGTYFPSEDIITLNRESFIDAMNGRGYVLLHEVGHATQLRRALKEGTNGFANPSYVPYGHMYAVKDADLLSLNHGPASDYLSTGFTFDEMHSFSRNASQMVSDAKRGKLTVAPAIVDNMVATLRRNSYTVNAFAYEALAAVKTLTKGSNGRTASGMVLESAEEWVQVDGKRHKINFVYVSKPIKTASGATEMQEMRFMIPPHTGDYRAEVERQLNRLVKSSYDVWKKADILEAQWSSLRPKPAAPAGQ